MQNSATIMENCMDVPQNIKIELYMIQQFHSWVYIEKKWNQFVEKIYVFLCLLQYYSFTISKYQFSVYQPMNKW
jgi:hypothetical protein